MMLECYINLNIKKINFFLWYKTNLESVIGKKQEILDLFTNFNNICSEEELQKIEYSLHKAIRRGDVEFIKILLSETIENDSFLFKIDRTNQTASLFNVKSNIGKIIVPRTVKYESVDYLIASICFIDSIDIKFVEDSAVKTIYGYLFPYSSSPKKILYSR